MKQRGKLLVIVGSLVLVLVLALTPLLGGCAAEKGPIKIGFAAAQTGDIGPWWPGCERMGKMVVDLINEDPPLGRPLQVITSDTESSPDGAVEVANYLGGQGVVFAVGYTSDGIWAALPVIERYGTPTFTHWSGTSKLDKTSAGEGRLFFRCCASDSEMAYLYGLYWEDELAPQDYNKVAFMYGTDEASRCTAGFAQESLAKAGADIVLVKEFAGEQATFSRLLSEVFAAEPDAIFLGCGVEQGSIIMKEWWDSSLSKDILWLVPDEWPTPEAVAAIVPEAGALDNKMIAPNPASGEAAEEFIGGAYSKMLSAYTAAYPSETDVEHAFVPAFYDSIVIGALAIQAAGEATQEAVSEFVPKVACPPGVKVYSYQEGKVALDAGEEINYEGAGSVCDFDAYGNIYPACSAYMLVNGKFQQIVVYSPDVVKAFISR